MQRPITLALCLGLLSLSATAAEPQQPFLEQRVQQLEQQVRELTERLGKLEKQPTAAAERPAYAVTLEEANAPEKVAVPGWKSVQSWEKVRRGMNQIQITQLLGNPSKRSGDRYSERWHYSDDNKAWVDFDQVREVSDWQTP